MLESAHDKSKISEMVRGESPINANNLNSLVSTQTHYYANPPFSDSDRLKSNENIASLDN